MFTALYDALKSVFTFEHLGFIFKYIVLAGVVYIVTGFLLFLNSQFIIAFTYIFASLTTETVVYLFTLLFYSYEAFWIYTLLKVNIFNS